MTVSAILTAAGESSRMGSPKPLLPWPSGRGDEITLVEYQVSQLGCAGIDEIIVVLGHRAEEVQPFVRGAGVQCVLNPDYRRGKTTSIRAGLSKIDSCAETVMLLAVDQPRPAAIIRRVLETHRLSGAAVTSPLHSGRGGHPIAFDSVLVPELREITEEGQGIREVIGRHLPRVRRVAIEDPAVRLDLNTPEDYRRGYDSATGLTSAT